MLSAADPLNLAGIVLPGPRIPAVATNTVTYVDGALERPGRRRIGRVLRLAGLPCLACWARRGSFQPGRTKWQVYPFGYRSR